jgi:regulator of sigma E protease
MPQIIGIIVGLFVLGAVVAWHELGHWISARALKFETPVFSIGIGGRALFSFKWKETLFTIHALPIGGYVEINGLVRGQDDDDRPLPAVWKRLLVMSAGIIMNLVATFAILFVLAMMTGRPAVQVVNFGAHSPAESAGIKVGDILEKVNGAPVYSYNDVVMMIASSQETVQITVRRDNTSFVVPVKKNEQNRVNVMLALDASKGESISPFQAASQAFVMTGELFKLQARFIGSLLGLHTLPPALHASMTGPIGITKALSQQLWMGLQPFLYLIAQINVGLAFLNLLPIPPLDGGRMVLVIVEAVARRPIPKFYEKVVFGAGMVLFLFVLVYTTGHDLWGLLQPASH